MIPADLSYSIIINAAPYLVWDVLVNPATMKQWMGDPEMNLEIHTGWIVGKPIIIKGFHHLAFENSGIVLHFEPGVHLSYNFLSSISRLPDIPGNYSIIEFHLAPSGNETALNVSISGFPNEVIFKHLEFYWRTSIHQLKKFVEDQTP